MVQPQLPAHREIVHLTVPEPNFGGRSAEGRRLLDAAGEVGLASMPSFAMQDSMLLPFYHRLVQGQGPALRFRTCLHEARAVKFIEGQVRAASLTCMLRRCSCRRHSRWACRTALRTRAAWAARVPPLCLPAMICSPQSGYGSPTL